MKNFLEKTLNTIEHTRSKSENARHAIALGISGGVTLVLFLIWAFVLLPFKFEQIVENSSPKIQNNSPFASLKAQIGSAYESFLSSVDSKTDSMQENLDWQNQYERIKSEAQTQ